MGCGASRNGGPPVVTPPERSGSADGAARAKPPEVPFNGSRTAAARDSSGCSAIQAGVPRSWAPAAVIARDAPPWNGRQGSGAGAGSGAQSAAAPLGRGPLLLEENAEGEGVSSWPAWLTGPLYDALRGWTPRKIASFQRLAKIGQGTYSTVHKAMDLVTGELVALKKIRLENLEYDTLEFISREIAILRRLDHPNVVKLLGVAVTREVGILYLIFEYLEHDLAGLATATGCQFSHAQIKFYMRQLMLGLKHCHDNNVMHRDIKGSNLLLDNEGNLKLADFGLAVMREPNDREPLTTRVITLWYRPPELLLGATQYTPHVDLWSVGCILAEMFYRKPVLTGRTEVEQLHKIFKLAGSEGVDNLATQSPYSTLMTPPQNYPRTVQQAFRDFPPPCLALVDKLLSIDPMKRGTADEVLQSAYFHTPPEPAHPSRLPKYPSSHEYLVRKEKDASRMRDSHRRMDQERQRQETYGTFDARRTSIDEASVASLRQERGEASGSALERNRTAPPRDGPVASNGAALHFKDQRRSSIRSRMPEDETLSNDDIVSQGIVPHAHGENDRRRATVLGPTTKGSSVHELKKPANGWAAQADASNKRRSFVPVDYRETSGTYADKQVYSQPNWVQSVSGFQTAETFNPEEDEHRAREFEARRRGPRMSTTYVG